MQQLSPQQRIAACKLPTKITPIGWVSNLSTMYFAIQHTRLFRTVYISCPQQGYVNTSIMVSIKHRLAVITSKYFPLSVSYMQTVMALLTCVVRWYGYQLYACTNRFVCLFSFGVQTTIRYILNGMELNCISAVARALPAMRWKPLLNGAKNPSHHITTL